VIQSATIRYLVGTFAGVALLLALGACTAASSATSSGQASEPARSVGASVSEGPSADLVTPPLGGGLILVHDAYDESNPGPVDVFTLDAATGQQTLLGTLPSGPGMLSDYNFQWGADRKHVLITQFLEGPVPLDNLTAAGRDLIVVCCAPVREALPNGQGTQALYAYDWALSPHGDQIAGLLKNQMDSIVIVDVDSGDLRTLQLPPGSHNNGYPISWSPDESAVVIGGCARAMTRTALA
jgi:hypothetical protein